jgi:hypothetical protein
MNDFLIKANSLYFKSHCRGGQLSTPTRIKHKRRYGFSKNFWGQL